jgi:DNA/RNA-binding domain of Phe-tRNA-synthetase-like protein
MPSRTPEQVSSSLPESIKIAQEIQQIEPRTTLLLTTATVKVEKKRPEVWQRIDAVVEELRAIGELGKIPGHGHIHDLATAYRKAGKDPTRYRGSAQALARRVLKGKALYQINNVVDINNLVSLESGFTLGSYDLDRLEPPFEFRLGRSEEEYRSIGKGLMNIESLPVFADAVGAFGSPTNDSERAMIRPTTERVLIVLVSFSGADASLEAAGESLGSYLERWAGAREVRREMVRAG